MTRIVSPSMLSADFGNLERDTKMIDGSMAEWIHIDVMDGVFVPNISYGFPVLKAIRRYTDKIVDVHLMIIEPEKYLERFVKAGADYLTFHLEATDCPEKCIEIISNAGAKVGISIKPATPVSALVPYLDRLDLVLIMSVEPGFGGQSFIEESKDRVVELRTMIDQRGLSTLIEIDGGVSAKNAGELFGLGCDALVAGSAVFSAPDPVAEVLNILNAE